MTLSIEGSVACRIFFAFRQKEASLRRKEGEYTLRSPNGGEFSPM